MKRIVAGIVTGGMLSGCSGKGDQVAMLVAAGAALTIVHKIQEEKWRNTGKAEEQCVTFCGPNEVPCGDECLPVGFLCYRAPRKACYGGDPNGPGIEMHTPNGRPNDGRTVGIAIPISG